MVDACRLFGSGSTPAQRTAEKRSVDVSICTAVYVIAQTSILGAILPTDYPRGATASQVSMGGQCFPIFVPTVFGARIWAGLFFWEDPLRASIPQRSSSPVSGAT